MSQPFEATTGRSSIVADLPVEEAFGVFAEDPGR